MALTKTIMYALKIFIFVIIFCARNSLGSRSKLVNLNEENWQEMLHGEWMVEFFAPWCPACKALQPIWNDFATWSDDLGISVGQVDVTSSAGLSGRFMVTALPTIFHVKDGVFRQYRGSRDKEVFMTFIEEKKWQALEEVPTWKSPASYQMSVVSQFFKLSMVLRGVHTALVEDYGLPTWGSYLVFAMSTIFIGAVLGLILVCVIDYLFPPKMTSHPVVKAKFSDRNSDEEDLIEDKDEEEEEDDEDVDVEEERSGEEDEEGRKSETEGGAEVEDIIREENSEPEANNTSEPSSPSVRKRRARKTD